MANIDSLNKTIAELEEKIARLNKFYEEQAKILEENKDSADYSSIQSKSYREEEELTKELGGSLETFMKKLNDITNKGLEDIENRIKKHSQTKFQSMREELEAEKEFIRASVEDKEKQHELLKKLEREFNRERAKLILTQSQQLVGAIQNLVNAGEAQLKEIEDTWGVTNQAAHDYGKAVGYNADQIKRLHDETISWMSDNDITEQFNIGADEMFKLMGNYNQQLGRAVALTNEAKINLVSMKNVIGEEQAIKFTTNLDKFGLDVDATKDLVEGLVGDARRSGIVLSNLTQNVADNLHLAQQYTFEDGIDGLVRMAEKATAVKWNMEQTAAFAEKVNSVEGAIKTGAQLSVLGGPFAQFSNPMGMLYESLNDMEGLQDRMFAMFGSLGQWNQEKGMLDISTFDKQRIRAAASAMGLNYSDVINNVNQQARRNVVMDQIKSYGLDENTTELLANTAQIDRETGRAYVMYNDEKIFANELGGRGDKNKILQYLQTQANSSDENLREIAHNTLGAKEMIEAVEKEFVVDRADFFRGIGVSKEGLAETHEKIMYAKYGLDKVSQLLNIIIGVVQAIAVASSFKGAFGGGSGTGVRTGGGARGTFSGRHQVFKGPKGTMVGADGRTSMQRALSQKGGFWNKTKAGAIGAWNSTKAGVGNFVKGGGAAMMLGIAGNIGAGYMHAQSDRLRASGNHEDADKVNTGAGALAGAANGAALGSMFGLAGMAVGAVLGGTIGGIVSAHENTRLEAERKQQEAAEREEQDRISELLDKKNEFRKKTGLILNGEYTPGFIDHLMRGKDYLGSGERDNLYAQGDGEVWEQLKPVYARGGVLKGSYHANGGMDVIDNQTGQVVAEVEGDEGIVPRDVMEKFGTVDNLINMAMRPLQPMGEVLQVNSDKNTPINSSLNVGGAASVNVGGTIQLSMPGGQTYNIAEDPAAMRMIGDSVMRHIMTANQQIFNKTEFYRKW